MTPIYAVDLVIQIGDHGTPGPFRTRIPAPNPMHAWAGALRKLRSHARLMGWDEDSYRVLSYSRFQPITQPEDR